MAWERRGHQRYYYRVTRDRTGYLRKRYYGMGLAAQRAFQEDLQQRAIRTQRRAERQHLQTLDAQLDTLTTVTQTLTKASLLRAGFHQHKRQWRVWKHIKNRPQEGEHIMDKQALPKAMGSYEMLEDVVFKAQNGDRTLLPTLRSILDQVPQIWEHSRVLAHQVERSWLKVLVGKDLLSEEIVTREVNRLRQQLLGSNPSPLESLLVDRICVCWLALQHAEMVTTKRLNAHQCLLSHGEEHRLDRLQHRLLAAIRELARVRHMLKPETKVQVNIGTNQLVA